MALAAVEQREEMFSKPPPKKKWLAEYIEQDREEEGDDNISKNLNSDAREFVRLFDKQTDNVHLKANLQQLAKDNKQQGPITLSQEVIGGVVQEVLNQFQSFFENGSSPSASVSFDETKVSPKLSVSMAGASVDPTKILPSYPAVITKQSSKTLQRLSVLNSVGSVPGPQPSPDPRISQHEITPVVQGVISQFLNGSLADTEFRRSRKRSHKHANSHHRDRAAGGGPGDRVRRASSVIKSRAEVTTRSLETPLERGAEQPTQDENEALNLSLPKLVGSPNKVTFALEDSCYSEECIQSFQASKSQEMSNLDILAHTATEDNPNYRTVDPTYLELTTPVIRRVVTPPESPLNMSLFPPDRRWSPSSPVCLTTSTTSQSLPPPATTSSPPPLTALRPPVVDPLSPPVVQVPHLISAPSTLPLYSSFSVIKPKPVKATHHLEESPSYKEEIKRSNTTTREVHNRLEKNRRAHLKLCFDELAGECDLDPKKASNLTVIKSAYKYIMSLRRKERENEKSLASLVQEKIRKQQRLEQLKREFPGHLESDSSE